MASETAGISGGDFTTRQTSSRALLKLAWVFSSLRKIHTTQYQIDEGVVSKETVVLRRWGSSIQKFGFINGVDNVNWPPYRDSKS